MSDKMLALAWSFPSLRNYPGVNDRFDPIDFESWARGAHATSGTVQSARFLLEVWNGYSGDKGKCPWKIGRFSLRSAMGTWDAPHLRAFLAWCGSHDRVMP